MQAYIYRLHINRQHKHIAIRKVYIRGGVENTRLEVKAKDTKKSEAKYSPSEDRPFRAKDRNARRQGQGPSTSASALKKKKIFKNFFQAISKKKSSQKFFQALHKIITTAIKSTKDRPIFEDLKLRGQGFDLRGQGQGLQNMPSMTPPLVYIFLAK